MDFELEETHRVIVRVATQVLESTEPDGVWKALGEAGLLTLAAPQSLGGEGLGVLEIAVLLRELGLRAAPTPAIGHLCAVLAVARSAPAEIQRDLLAPGVLLTTATRPTTAGDPGSARRSDQVRLSGMWCAPYADAVQGILVAVPGGVAVVDPADVELETVHSSSGVADFAIRAENVAARSFWPAEEGDLTLLQAVAACAFGDGLLAGALDLTTKHVATREQFGRPLATFQAVAQQIADIYIASRTTHLAALSAAWRLSTGRDAESDVDTAVTWLVQEGLAALRTCHHLHGGIGLDVTYPLHRYTAMMKDLVRHVPRAD